MWPENVLFTGFNGFGQFYNCQNQVARTFEKQILCPISCTLKIESFCVCSTWAYNAIAVNKILYISGAPLNESISTTKEFAFEINIKKVACNDSTCLALLVNGDVWKLCLETFELRKLNFVTTEMTPTRKPIFENESKPNEPIEFVIDIGCTYTFSIAITSCNSVYSIPSKICVLPKHVKVTKISCGAEHVLLLTSNGDVYAFGSSTRGQLGLSRLDVEEIPVLIEALAGIKVIDIAAGAWHSAAVSAYGDLYVWGWNVNGQLGRPLHEQVKISFDDGSTDVIKHKLPSVFAQPEIVDIPCGNGDDDSVKPYQISAVNCGARHTIVVTECGRLFGCGWNKYGQLGLAHSDGDVVKFEPLLNDDLIEISSVTCGAWCTLVYLR